MGDEMELDNTVALLVNGRPQEHTRLTLEQSGDELVVRSEFYADEDTEWFWRSVTPNKRITLKIGDDVVSEGVVGWSGNTFLSDGRCLVRWIHTGKPPEERE